ncbi:HD domain-containing protein [Thermodesulfobacteriota bacterium]
MIPTPEECFGLMEKYGMLDNIRAHSVMVEKVANTIALGIREVGFNISIEKVTAGALMHDIGKTLCLNSSDDHAAKGKEICIQNNFIEIAGIVEEHVRLKSYEIDYASSEKEIIYYSDKRVNHDRIVTLEERLEYLLVRYAKDKEALGKLIKDNFKKCREVEKKLFLKLNFRPEDLAEMIENT